MTIYLTKSSKNDHQYHSNSNVTTSYTIKKDTLQSSTYSTKGTLVSVDNSFTNSKQRRNKIMSLFPSSKNEVTSNNTYKNDSVKWRKTTDGNNKNSNKAQTISCPTSTSFFNSPATASSSTISSSSTSSSTVYQIATLSGPHFQVADSSCIPDYTILRKHFSKFKNKSKNRIDILKFQLLPWLRKYALHLRLVKYKSTASVEEQENRFWGLRNATKEKKELQFGRSTLLRWWRSLLGNLLIIEADERHVYYECIIVIMSRCEFTDYGSFDYLQWNNYNSVPNTASVDEYRQLLSSTLKYAIDKLNQKAIYSNMISFCAKVLALCYFKIPGLAASLLQVLKIRPTIMKKLRNEMSTSEKSNHHLRYKDNDLQIIFPPFLHQLMTSDTLSYQNYFATIKSQQSKLPISLTGNWVRRWQSDDSELFFSFYRHYHTALKSYVSIVYPVIAQHQLHQRNAILMNLPGYMYFASFFACKIDSLIHREINSVTTISDNDQQRQQQPADKSKKVRFILPSIVASGDKNISVIDETESFISTTIEDSTTDYNNATVKAHLNAPTGKPNLLVLATKRYAGCMVWCIVAADKMGLYHDMINVWIRFAVKRTLLREAEVVYCLIDFIEQTIIELQKFPLKNNYFPIDLPFILHTLDIILSQSDHTASILRALSFIYVHFGFLTSHAALLDLLCNHIMLDTQIFERLLLHWGKSVRHSFLRCLVWRVGRVWQSTEIRWNSETEQIMKTAAQKNKSIGSVCNGHSCWVEWEGKNEKTVLSNTTPIEILAYRKCSLQVHILLEALMASFHRHYSYLLQHSYNTKSQICSNLNMSDVVSHISECATPIPQRTTKFVSQLTVLPPSPKVPKPQGENSNSNNAVKPIYSTNGQKRCRTSPNEMKKNIVLKSRNGRDRLRKLFNSNSSNHAVMQDSIMSNNLTEAEHDDIDNIKEEKDMQNQFYTVSSPYSVSSLLILPSNVTDKNERVSIDVLDGQSIKKAYNSTDTVNISNNMQTDNNIPDYTSSKLNNDNDAECARDENDIEEKNESGNKLNAYLEPPVILTSSRNWKYHPSKHVYATKALSDLRVILHEYSIWLNKNQPSANSSIVFVPRLFLEWPKNWTYTNP